MRHFINGLPIQGGAVDIIGGFPIHEKIVSKIMRIHEKIISKIMRKMISKEKLHLKKRLCPSCMRMVGVRNGFNVRHKVRKGKGAVRCDQSLTATGRTFEYSREQLINEYY